MTAPSADKEALRVLRRLSTKGARLVSTGDGCWRLESAGKTTPNLSSTSIEALRARGLVASDGSNGLILAEIGMRLLRRSLPAATISPLSIRIAPSCSSATRTARGR